MEYLIKVKHRPGAVWAKWGSLILTAKVQIRAWNRTVVSAELTKRKKKKIILNRNRKRPKKFWSFRSGFLTLWYVSNSCSDYFVSYLEVLDSGSGLTVIEPSHVHVRDPIAIIRVAREEQKNGGLLTRPWRTNPAMQGARRAAPSAR